MSQKMLVFTNSAYIHMTLNVSLVAVSYPRRTDGVSCSPSLPAWFQSSTGSVKGKNSAKNDITTFFSPKSNAGGGQANGGGSSSNKKRKAGSKSPGASNGFVSFCRANRTRVSLPYT